MSDCSWEPWETMSDRMDFMSVAMSDRMDFMSVRCSAWRRSLSACVDWSWDWNWEVITINVDMMVE